MTTETVTKTAIKQFTGENFTDWEASVIASGANASSKHRKGLLGFFLTEANYILHATAIDALAPAEPFEALPDAAAQMPAAGAQFAPWAYVKEQKDQELKDITNWTILFIASLDDNSIGEMSEGRKLGITRLSLRYMYQWMCDHHGTVTTAYLDKNRGLPDLPFVDDGTKTVTTYIKENHSGPHKIAAENGEAMPETVKVSKLTNGLIPCGQFKTVLEHFVFTYKTPATQTFEVLCNLVRVFDVGREVRKTSGGSGLMNQAVVDQNTIQTLTRQMEQLQAAIAVLTANAVCGPVPNNNHKRGATTKINPRAHYCWTHSSNNSHASIDCRFPRDGHKTAATFDNQMGGATEYPSNRGKR